MNKQEKRPKENQNESPEVIKKFKLYIENLFKSIVKELIHIDFVELSFNYAKYDDRGIIFSISHSDPYHQACVTIYPLAVNIWKEKRYEDIFSGALHEMCHLHTASMGDIAHNRFASKQEIENKIEHVTEVIKKYILDNKELINNFKGRNLIKQKGHKATKH